MRPKLFIGSSSEGRDVAYAVHEHLEDDAEVTIWDQGVFQPARYTLEALLTALASSDFGLFVLSPDDAIRIRDQEYLIPRDNVLIELGIFVGRLGPERCFILRPSGVGNLRLPTDLEGIIFVSYRPDRDDKNLVAAVGPACNKIRKTIRRQIE